MNGLIIALETSARAASVAVRAGGRVVEVALASGRAHASDLLPALDRVVRELGGTPREIALVLVGTGPGSYTGLRVGIATALGLARGCGAKLRGIPSGETLAFGELAPGEEACVLLDARAGELYFAHYRRLVDEVEVMHAPCVLTPADLAAVLPKDVRIFGDASVAEVAGLDTSERARLVTDVLPRARALLALGSHRLERLGGEAPHDIRPLYLRPFAVRERRR